MMTQDEAVVLQMLANIKRTEAETEVFKAQVKLLEAQAAQIVKTVE